MEKTVKVSAAEIDPEEFDIRSFCINGIPLIKYKNKKEFFAKLAKKWGAQIKELYPACAEGEHSAPERYLNLLLCVARGGQSTEFAKKNGEKLCCMLPAIFNNESLVKGNPEREYEAWFRYAFEEKWKDAEIPDTIKALRKQAGAMSSVGRYLEYGKKRIAKPSTQGSVPLEWIEKELVQRLRSAYSDCFLLLRENDETRKAAVNASKVLGVDKANPDRFILGVSSFRKIPLLFPLFPVYYTLRGLKTFVAEKHSSPKMEEILYGEPLEISGLSVGTYRMIYEEALCLTMANQRWISSEMSANYMPTKVPRESHEYLYDSSIYEWEEVPFPLFLCKVDRLAEYITNQVRLPPEGYLALLDLIPKYLYTSSFEREQFKADYRACISKRSDRKDGPDTIGNQNECMDQLCGAISVFHSLASPKSYDISEKVTEEAEKEDRLNQWPQIIQSAVMRLKKLGFKDLPQPKKKGKWAGKSRDEKADTYYGLVDSFFFTGDAEECLLASCVKYPIFKESYHESNILSYFGEMKESLCIQVKDALRQRGDEQQWFDHEKEKLSYFYKNKSFKRFVENQMDIPTCLSFVENYVLGYHPENKTIREDLLHALPENSSLHSLIDDLWDRQPEDMFSIYAVLRNVALDCICDLCCAEFFRAMLYTYGGKRSADV